MKPATIALLLSAQAVQATRSPFLQHRYGGGGGGFNKRPAVGWGSRSSIRSRQSNTALIQFPRGGDGDVESAVIEDGTTSSSTQQEEQSLDDRVHAAMRRLGLEEPTEEPSSSDAQDTGVVPPPPPPPQLVDDSGMNCEGGVCTIDNESETTTSTSAAEEELPNDTSSDTSTPITEEQMYSKAEELSNEMSVPKDIALAAIYSSFSGTDSSNRQMNEQTARSIIQNEIDAISNISQDCEEVTQLVNEGYDIFFARRALAFSDMNVDNARAILLADQEDEEMEQREMEEAQKQAAQRQQQEQEEMKTVTVDFPNFDPTVAAATQQPKEQQKPQGAPPPAKKEDVVFELEDIQDLQRLVIESPVPVLLDVYADWCGPCKQLTPALEEICIKAGGMLRLVKVNTDQQRQVSGALQVKALPTIFGIKDGKIQHMFQGMPRDENMLRNFLMGLMVPGQKFNPPVTDEELSTYNELSNKLLKLAAGASFTFSARERLQVHVGKLLDQLVTSIGGNTGMAIADDSARVLRSLMSNIIENPFETKYRKIKLDNKVIAAKIAQHKPCMSILKSIGFVEEGESALVVAKGKRIVNIAPFVEGRNTIDRWIDKNRYQIAAEGRKRKDEMNRARLAAEAEEAAKNQVDEEEEEEEEESEEEEDSNVCMLKLRLEGKKKVHDIELDGEEDTLSTLLQKLPFPVEDGEVVQFTCVAKRLIVKSTDSAQMSKTLSQLKLMPSASIVIKIGDGQTDTSSSTKKGSLAERAASKKKKTGSHSMHSIGLYAQDDGNKAETFESGGVLYDHVLSDDEEEDGEEDGDGDEEEADENDEGSDDE